jgi:hypothetical protein
MKINEMTTENDNNSIDNNKAEEPSAAYETANNKRIQIFHSYEEMNESQYEHWRNLSHLQRLQEHYKLLTITFTTEQLNSNNNRIIFDH